MRPHRKLLFGGLSFALALSVAGCAAEPTAPTPEAPKVTVMQPQPRGLTDYVEYNGWMKGDAVQEVRARVRGHIKKVHFTDGKLVKKGDPLFDLDPRPFQAEVDRIKDKVKVYEAQKVAAAKDEKRLKDLLTKGGASQAQVDKAEADVKSLDAQISSTQNDIERSRLDLEYSHIKADIDGRVGEAKLTEGNLVNVGGSDPLLTTIVKLDPIRVYFNVDERTLLSFGKNMGLKGKSLNDLLAALKDTKAPFTFALDDETEFTHKGTIAFGDNKIDPATGTLLVYGTASNKEGKFVQGGRVRVRLPVGKEYPALLVPETAILSDQDQRYVLTADEKNTVRRRNVLLGKLTDDGMRAVRSADKLAEGERPENWRVIVDNLQRARLNYPVNPQQPPAAKSGA